MAETETRKATQQSAAQTWHLRAGRERGNRYAVIDGDGVSWTALRQIATPFDSKAEAGIGQSDIVSELGIGIAVVSRIGPGPDRPRQHGEN